ncbi:FMN-binding protein [Emergencia sp.]|uniref:FMN-binding protein n=1 Tax=Emergencia sp. TaxID=1926557 RepID=UPI003AF158C4
MGIVLGYISLLCFILLSAKIFTHKFHITKADKVLRILHQPLCCILTVSCIFHFIFVIPVFKTRNLFIYITGILIALLLIFMIFFCHVKRKNTVEWLKWHRVLAGVMFLLIVGHIAIYCFDFRDYQTKIKNIQLQGLDVSNIADGTYIGEYDAGYIYTKVEIIISNGTIENIILFEHENERGQAAEQVISNIVDTQAFPVDAITGATNSSKVIQKAIQNALEGATLKK